MSKDRKPGPVSEDPELERLSGVRVAFCTIGSVDKATSLARLIVEEKLAACVNIVSNVHSVFRWEGQIHEESEALMVIKTTTEREDDLKKFLGSHHPYEVPELLLLPCSSGLEKYMSWITESCREESK